MVKYEKIKEKAEFVKSICFKLFILCYLLFPATMFSHQMYNIDCPAFYPDLILVNVFVWCIMLLNIVQYSRNRKVNKKNIGMLIYLIIMLVGYCVFYQIFYNNIQWQWERVNVATSFLFFFMLLATENREFLNKYKIIEFLIGAIIITNLIAIIFYIAGGMEYRIVNWKFTIRPQNVEGYHEYRFDWVYSHKSHYGCMLLLYIMLLMKNQNYFKKKMLFILSLAILYIDLYLTHSNVAIIGGILILGMYIFETLYHWNKKIVYALPAFLVVGVVTGTLLLKKIGQERDLSSLGLRTYIWKSSIKEILNNIGGIGNEFQVKAIELETGYKVYNCHNVFLNEMFRFSLPAGICFSLFIIGTIFFCIVRKVSWTIRVGLLFVVLLMCMDASILCPDLSMFLFMIYMLVFVNSEETKGIL